MKTKKYWDKWLSNYKHTIRNGTVNIDGDVDFSNMGLTKLPFKFGKVSGNFYCSNNKLISLEGVPKHVGGSFYCYSNSIVLIKGVQGKMYF